MILQTNPGQTGNAGAITPAICRRLFSIDQAADVAGMPVHVICRWIGTRKLGAYHLGGGLIRVDETELADLLTSPEA